MEFFEKAKVVRLKSHLNKFLTAKEDEVKVKQRLNGLSSKALWTVELVQANNHVNPEAIRLISSFGKYLTASGEPFLLGMTGKRVIQSVPCESSDDSVEWEPVNDGGLVKLRTKCGKFLRANGTMPPWRNSVTHDLPISSATQDWILWEVEVVEALPSTTTTSGRRSPTIASNSKTRSSSLASNTSRFTSTRQNGMEFFDKVKEVKLESHLGKYLVAGEDQETVRQSVNSSSSKARWTVEYVEGKTNVIRLKSCHGMYLTATDDTYLLGMTGKKVTQTLPSELDSSVEWEPIKEGSLVKLRTSEKTYLRANGLTPPWRNSVTHDAPSHSATQDWVLWGVDILDSDFGSGNFSRTSSFTSLLDDHSPCSLPESPMETLKNASEQQESLGHDVRNSWKNCNSVVFGIIIGLFGIILGYVIIMLVLGLLKLIMPSIKSVWDLSIGLLGEWIARNIVCFCFQYFFGIQLG